MATEEGPSTYRHFRTSTPTYDSRIKTEAGRVAREVRELADRWRGDEEVDDADASDEGECRERTEPNADNAVKRDIFAEIAAQPSPTKTDGPAGRPRSPPTTGSQNLGRVSRRYHFRQIKSRHS
jgi:hypothetical protein